MKSELSFPSLYYSGAHLDTSGLLLVPETVSHLDKQTSLPLLKHPQLFPPRTSSAWRLASAPFFHKSILSYPWAPVCQVGANFLPSSSLLVSQVWSCQLPALFSFSSECLCSSPLLLLKLLLGYMILFVPQTV